jgi:hypothetical protein
MYSARRLNFLVTVMRTGPSVFGLAERQSPVRPTTPESCHSLSINTKKKGLIFYGESRFLNSWENDLLATSDTESGLRAT